MKLVEILAKELKEWPEGYTRIVQTMKELNLPIDHEAVRFKSGQWDYSDVSSRIYDAKFETSEVADDYRTAIVTKEMWEAEKAKQNSLSAVASDDELWGDVKEMYTKENEVFNPIYCRDRIKEIDSLVESLEEERLSLVQALEDEGFVLVSTALASAVIDKAIVRASKVEEVKEDMTDWRNWREGDLVEFISFIKEDDCFHVGGVYEISKIKPNNYNEIDVVSDDENDPNGWRAEYFRWHSRPQQ